MNPSPGELLEPVQDADEAHFPPLLRVDRRLDHPVHYHVEYAQKMRFGKPVAQGFLLASITALGALPAGPRIDGFVLVERGCRFPKAVVIGHTITPHLCVEESWREGRRHFVRFKTTLINQRGEIMLGAFTCIIC